MSISYKITSDKKEENELYYIISGRIPANYRYLLNNYDISDPNSEFVLKYCKWEDYRDKEEYKNFMVKNSDYYQTVTKKYTLEDLKDAVLRFLIPKGEDTVTDNVRKAYKEHLAQMEKTYHHNKSDRLSIDEKKACALVLSYYTGDKVNSDRLSQNTNAVLRAGNSEKIVKGWDEGERYYPLIYYLTKAISSLPFYWGYTIRCIHLSQEQALSYQPGVVVTWLNWSSSSIGKDPAGFCSDRNCYFFIYSFSSRDITKFSNYESEKESLYPPFSHFLVFKNEIKNGHHNIYMRQIEIGLYPNNIIWVDDNILNKDWENKRLMEMAYYNSKMLKIIPKISTETALAFITSFKYIINNGGCKYKIMSDMTRYNENPPKNAGARFVKSLQDAGFSHLEVMIFTSSRELAISELRKLNANMNSNLKVTTSTGDAVKFLTMN